YPDTLMAVCWAGWRFGCLERRQLRPFLSKVALGGIAGTLLAVPMLLAMASYLGHADLGPHADMRLGAAHLRASALPQLLMPYVYGQINGDAHATTWITVGVFISNKLLHFSGLSS